MLLACWWQALLCRNRRPGLPTTVGGSRVLQAAGGSQLLRTSSEQQRAYQQQEPGTCRSDCQGTEVAGAAQ